MTAKRTMILVALAAAGAVLGLGAAPASAGAVPSGDATAETAKKKPKPCVNQTRRYVLCKPKVGTWKGKVTQRTPTGLESYPLQLTVERDGDKKNGTEIGGESYSLPWWGQGPDGLTSWVWLGEDVFAPESFCPACAPILYSPSLCCSGDHWDKRDGFFYSYGSIRDELGEVGSDFIKGDFVSRTKVKGTAEANHRSFGTLLKVTWKATWSTKALPPPPPCTDPDFCFTQTQGR